MSKLVGNSQFFQDQIKGLHEKAGLENKFLTDKYSELWGEKVSIGLSGENTVITSKHHSITLTQDEIDAFKITG